MYSEIFFSLGHGTVNVESTLMSIRLDYDPFVKDAFSIGQSYQVAVSFSKNIDCMPRLVRIQMQGTLGDQRLIKKVHGLAILLLQVINKGDVFLHRLFLAPAF